MANLKLKVKNYNKHTSFEVREDKTILIADKSFPNWKLFPPIWTYHNHTETFQIYINHTCDWKPYNI